MCDELEENMKKQTLSSIIAEFLWVGKAENKSATTLENYKYALKAFLNFVGDIDINDLEQRQIREYIAYDLSRTINGQPVSSQTALKHFSVVRYFCNWAYSERIISINPAIGIRPPNTGDEMPKVLSQAELKSIFRQLSDKDRFRDKVIFELFLSTGIRLSECANLNIEDIDFENKFLHILHGKGKKQGRVPLEPIVTRDLSTYIHRHREALDKEKALFVNYQGMRLESRGIQTMVKRVLNKAGVDKKAGPHILRHTFATEFLRAGGGIEQLRKILRHASVTITERYLHLIDEDVQAEHLKISPIASMRKRRIF